MHMQRKAQASQAASARESQATPAVAAAAGPYPSEAAESDAAEEAARRC